MKKKLTTALVVFLLVAGNLAILLVPYKLYIASFLVYKIAVLGIFDLFWLCVFLVVLRIRAREALKSRKFEVQAFGLTHRLEDVTQKYRVYQGIFDVTQAFMKDISISAMMNALANAVRDVLSVDTVFIRVYRIKNITEQIDFIAGGGEQNAASFYLPEPLLKDISSKSNSILVNNIPAEKKYRELAEQGYESMCMARLSLDDTQLGLIGAFTRTRRNFLDSELDIMRKFGGQAAANFQTAMMIQVIKNYYPSVVGQEGTVDFNKFLHAFSFEQKKTADDMALAEVIANELIPNKFVDKEGLEISGFYKPARKVGGDYYDVIELQDGRLAVLISDVSGKGVSATLVVMMMRTFVRAIINQVNSPAEVLRRLNSFMLAEGTAEKYATFSMIFINRERTQVVFTDAGHGPLKVYNEHSGDLAVLTTQGSVVGIQAEFELTEATHPLKPGDIILMHSDGIHEAMNADHAEYTNERLLTVVREHKGSHADEITRAIITDVDAFVGAAEQHDDETLVVIKYTGQR